MHHIHVAFMTWAIIAGVAVGAAALGLFGRALRRNLAMLAVCATLGAAVAFGVTGWFGGQSHARLAKTAAHPAAHQAGVTVNSMLDGAFATTFIVVTGLALIVAAIATRRRPRRPARRPAARGGW